MSNLLVDESRLWSSLMETAKIGAHDGGVRRLTLGPEDKLVRDWFARECADLGMTVTVDEVGNMFALRAGKADVPPIAMGSHLDTQPTGGRFDGILGVLAGMEAVRVLHDAGFVTEAPVMVINWTNEEGSRFSPSMLGSGVYTGVFGRAFADARRDVAGEAFGDALDAIGYRGTTRAGAVPFQAMFELHIEQGPILEAEGSRIGVVQGVQGIRWYEATLTGTPAHTGTTPMALRRDALAAGAQLVLEVERLALAHEGAVGTVGFMEVSPNSTNVIPGDLRLTVDFRHPDDRVLDALETALHGFAADVATARGVDIDIRQISQTDAVVFDADCVASVRQAVARLGLPARDMVSGAGHDAQHLAKVVPTTMIFVPSEAGLSHNPAEFTASADCAAGAQVLLEAVLDYDRKMAERRAA